MALETWHSGLTALGRYVLVVLDQESELLQISARTPGRPFRPAMPRTHAVWGIGVVLADRGSRKRDTSLTKTSSDIQQELSRRPCSEISYMT